MLLGLLGGVLGVVGVYLAEEWARALGWRLAVAGPLVGLLPAWRAAKIEPIAALRS